MSATQTKRSKISKAKSKDSTQQRAIEIVNARQNNLHDLSCSIPHGQLTVVTGPSGSGKSSLAFDTLYAEGQRRYIESLSAYARQFLARLEKPDVDQILNVLPAVALEQKNSVKNARSTVGTATDIYDFVKLLFTNLGQVTCQACGSHSVTTVSPDAIVDELMQLPDKTRVLLIAPVDLNDHSLETLSQQGFFRYVNDGSTLVDFTATTELKDLPKFIQKAKRLPILVDRLAIKLGQESRLREALQTAFRLTGGTVVVRRLEGKDVHLDNLYQEGFSCLDCGATATKPQAHHFSFNHPLGACPTCEGFGRIIGLDPQKIIPNPELSLADGAVHPFQTPANQILQEQLEAICASEGISTEVPYNQLTDEERLLVWQGVGGIRSAYPGIRGFFEWLESKRYKVHVRVMLAKYRGYYECPDCQGSRLRKEALNVRVDGRTILDWVNTPVSQLLEWVQALEIPPNYEQVAGRLKTELSKRLDYLKRVGLDYLTLSRNMRTLSGGESQRIHLSTALGTALTETLYVLDEPTVGLHPRDTERLISILHALRDNGNTLVVVEHDADVMRAADRILDIGPASGEHGGRLVFDGSYDELKKKSESLTGRWLREELEQTLDDTEHRLPPASLQGPVRITGANGNNLQNLTVELPTQKLVGICGVSGSGKSTLIQQTLYANYRLSQGDLPTDDIAPVERIDGLAAFEDVVLVDQSPPGRSQRSNPATYMKAYDEIRQLFASSAKAQMLGVTAGDFSFNSGGGRCETCEGLGTVTVDMQFMADVTMRCPECDGKRFQPKVLSVDLFDKTIADVLDMSIDEAMRFFRTAPKVSKKLEPLQALGLGYLRLGQSTSTLSGGEAQRLKLAGYLKETQRKPSARKQFRPKLFLFDEPTTGLHMADVHTLVGVLRQLVDAGHTVWVIEHNLELLARCDWLLELGPDGGERGGQIVAEGSPGVIAHCKQSETARFMAEMLAHH